MGEVTERLKVYDWKSYVRLTPYRGFESLPLRQESQGLRIEPLNRLGLMNSSAYDRDVDC